MPTTIADFADGSMLEFDQGGIDRWCVYLTRPNQPRFAPQDIYYFTGLQQFAAKYGAERVYGDFVKIYDATGNNISPATLDLIEGISQGYGNDALEVRILFALLYAVMLSEQNRAGTKLGKRIKRLGIHQHLIDGLTIPQAANFSRGMGWRDIATLCQNRGF